MKYVSAWARVYRIYILASLCVLYAWGARPMITDDARVVDRHSCQLETWGVLSAGVREFWAIPGCNFGFDTEINLGAMMSDEALPKDRAQRAAFGSRELVFAITNPSIVRWAWS